MPYCYQRKIFWYTPARTASRSCSEIISYLKFTDVNSHYFISKDEQRNFHFICNVRNPYTRLVSLYQLKKSEHPNYISDFENWLINKFKYPAQNKFLDWETLHPYEDFKKFQIQIKEIIKQESILEDVLKLQIIRENLNPTLFEIIHDKIFINRYKEENFEKKNWSEYYNENIADLVKKNLEYEFEMFNYNINYWKDGTP